MQTKPHTKTCPDPPKASQRFPNLLEITSFLKIHFFFDIFERQEPAQTCGGATLNSNNPNLMRVGKNVQIDDLGLSNPSRIGFQIDDKMMFKKYFIFLR